MQYLKSTCTKKMNTVIALANNSWGADQEVIIKTYQALIRSKLDCAIVYNSAIPSTLKIIDPIQNVALRIATGSYRSMYLFELKETSRKQRRKYLSLKYVVKMFSTPDNPTYNNIFTNRYMQLETKKQKLPIPFNARIAKYTTLVEITSTPTISTKTQENSSLDFKNP